MFDPSLAILLFAIFLGCYLQTVSGFASGMVVMGIAAGFNVVSVETAAIIVGAIALANGIVVLGYASYRNQLNQVQWGVTGKLLLGMTPAIVFGVWLLGYLSNEAVLASKLILGCFITGGAILLVLKPHPKETLTSSIGWLFTGIVGGTFGGLFSVSGPPLVYVIYRQPLLIEQIRVTLIATFTITALVRLVVVYVDGDLTREVLMLCLLSLPVVFVSTFLGNRFPPKLDDLGMRRLAFTVLCVIGVTVTLKSLYGLLS